MPMDVIFDHGMGVEFRGLALEAEEWVVRESWKKGT